MKIESVIVDSIEFSKCIMDAEIFPFESGRKAVGCYAELIRVFEEDKDMKSYFGCKELNDTTSVSTVAQLVGSQKFRQASFHVSAEFSNCIQCVCFPNMYVSQRNSPVYSKNHFLYFPFMRLLELRFAKCLKDVHAHLFLLLHSMNVVQTLL